MMKKVTNGHNKGHRMRSKVIILWYVKLGKLLSGHEPHEQEPF